MDIFLKRIARGLGLAVLASGLLGGCVAVPANYGPPYEAQPAYGYGAYVRPPVYVEPPVYFNFGFGYWSGRGGHYGHHRRGH